VSAAPVVLEVPDLRGDGFVLRPWRVDDAPSLSRAWHDPAIIAGSTPPPDRSEAAAARWIEGWEERRLRGLALDLVVADPAGGDVLGEVGLWSLSTTPHPVASIGWWIHEEHRGRGLATAAVRAVAHWVVAETVLASVQAEIQADNTASLAVAQRAGFHLVSDGNPQIWLRDRAPEEPELMNAT
jgi:RimJ/RimL family protein N-acetyltransferase